MTWFAFQGLNSGKAIDIAGVQEKDAVAWGFHGYASESQAEANPNAVNAVTKIAADLLIADYHTAVAQGSQPGGPNANILNPAIAARGALQGVASSIGLGNVDNFFQALTQGSTWIRVAEVGAGLMILYAALKAITTPQGANPVHRTFKDTALRVASPGVSAVAKASVRAKARKSA